MRLPSTATFFVALAAAILLLTVVSATPGVDGPEAYLPSIGWFGAAELLGLLSLLAIVVVTVLLFTRTPRR